MWEFAAVLAFGAASFAAGFVMRAHMSTVAEKAVSAVTAAAKMPAGTPAPIVATAAEIRDIVATELKKLFPPETPAGPKPV